ncbi:MAG: hypothetical protein J6386_02390 [Candidatus Synoicihabitans palmerolidicus]|nr:hypothetical protein [Candidatus Synoicihabitans palmerolidicus]
MALRQNYRGRGPYIMGTLSLGGLEGRIVKDEAHMAMVLGDTARDTEFVETPGKDFADGAERESDWLAGRLNLNRRLGRGVAGDP